MSPTVSINLGSFNASVARLRSVNKKETPVFVRTLAKELLKYLVRLTPPFGYPPSPRTETMGNQLRAGREAIRREIQSGFQPINTIGMIRNPTGRLGKTLRGLVNQGRLAEASDLIRKTGHFNIAGIIDTVDSEAHRRLRDRRGKITTKRSFLVTKSASVGQRIRKVQKRVGYAKAGWMKAAWGLGTLSKFPNWITQHTTPGYYKESGILHFTVTMANRVKYGLRFTTSIVPKALEFLKGSVEAQYTALINKRHKRRT